VQSHSALCIDTHTKQGKSVSKFKDEAQTALFKDPVRTAQ